MAEEVAKSTMASSAEAGVEKQMQAAMSNTVNVSFTMNHLLPINEPTTRDLKICAIHIAPRRG
jgi:hypothetical protein